MEYERDLSCGIYTRKKISDMTSIQIAFYIYCALQVNLLKKELPRILIYGSNGLLGTKLVNDLVNIGLSPYLRLYCRSDNDIDFWLSRHIEASDSLIKLFPKKLKPDIVIIMTPLLGFPVVARQIKSYVTRQTMIIFATVGLQRSTISLLSL